MKRTTGTYKSTTWENETVQAFVPTPLPPVNPPIVLDDAIRQSLSDALTALGNLAIAADMVPNADWFLYGFIRKEALITSQIEGTQATLQDVLAFEAGEKAERPDDVQEVCNYVDALAYARKELTKTHGLPISVRLFCNIHKRLMQGVRGSDKQPGQIRRSQNWIGGTRPGNARFVPPPPELVPEALSALEKWIHSDDKLPPLIRIGLAHVQFETIHPFLDGNGRIGRLLIALLVEHWGILQAPLLYLSVAFKRHRQDYYDHLNAVRVSGDWENWTRFFLDCVAEAAADAVTSAQRLHALTATDRQRVHAQPTTTVPAIRLFERLPSHPLVTLPRSCELLGVSKPTAIKALDALQAAGVLHEITGKRRDRVYAYQAYLQILAPDTQ